jgi:hypothetical protein
MNRFVKSVIKFLLKRSENLDKSFKNSDPNDPMHKRMRSMWEKRERMRLAVEYAENGAPSTRMSDVLSKTLEAKQKALNTHTRKNNRAKKRAQR